MQHNRILTYLAATAVVMGVGLSPPVTGVARAATITVQSGGASAPYWFLPQDLGNINVGDTIIWENVSGTHNIQSARIPDGASSWVSPNLAVGQTFSRRFTVPGNYRYFCFHATADEANATPQVTNRQIGQFTVVADLTATPTITGTPTATPIKTITVKVTLLDTKIVVTPKTVPRGEVVFEVTNGAKKPHDFKIAGKKTALLASGKSANLSVRFPTAGARSTFISTGGGRTMKGVLKISLQGDIGLTGNTGLTGALGITGPPGIAGETGIAGNTVRSGGGSSAPNVNTGALGDFFIRTGSNTIWGPKTTSTGWGTAVNLTGPIGAAGKTVLNGTIAPLATTGTNGDFYIHTGANTIQGPKASGAWGSAVNLVGPTGPIGLTGPIGPAGASAVNGDVCDPDGPGPIVAGVINWVNNAGVYALTCNTN